MDRDGFVKLALIAFGLILASFVVLGFSRVVLPFHVAQVLSAPIGFVGFALVVYLFVRATLDAVGVWRIDRADH